MPGAGDAADAPARGGPLIAGESFRAEFAVDPRDVAAYVDLSRVDNGRALADAASSAAGGGGGEGGAPVVPGRAVLSRIEGEMTRHPRMRGRRLLLVGADGDPAWGGRSVRFVRPLLAGELLSVTYTVSSVDNGGRSGGGRGGGRIAVDFEGRSAAGLVVVARRNLYLAGDVG